jgi:hypothetical protein
VLAGLGLKVRVSRVRVSVSRVRVRVRERFRVRGNTTHKFKQASVHFKAFIVPAG